MFEDTFFSSLANLWGMSGTSYTYLSRICFCANNSMTHIMTMQGKRSFFDWIPQAHKSHCHCLSMSKQAGKSAVSNITPVFRIFCYAWFWLLTAFLLDLEPSNRYRDSVFGLPTLQTDMVGIRRLNDKRQNGDDNCRPVCFDVAILFSKPFHPHMRERVLQQSAVFLPKCIIESKNCLHETGFRGTSSHHGCSWKIITVKSFNPKLMV